MYEHIPQSNLEQEMTKGLFELAAKYLEAEDVEFLQELDDFDEKLSYVYGRLLEIGENPEEILNEFGVIEGDGYEV